MRSVVAVAALVLLLLTGCTAGGGSDAAGSADGIEQGPAGGSEAAMAQSDAAAAGQVGDDLGAAAADEARQVITEGTVAMTVEDPRQAVQDAAALVEGAGGRVQERVEQAESDDRPASARLVVRVPSAGLTPVLAELERLGTVDDIQLRSTDVTGQAQDLDARIRALQISVTRLEDLLTRAESTADLVAAESSLTQRQSDLEQLQSQRARLADQVEMSTLALELRADDPAPALEPAGFWGGLVTGWESLVTALSAALLVAGVLLPWAAVAAVLLVLWLAVRRRLRGRRPGRVASSADASASAT